MTADVTARLAEALAEIGDRTLPPRILAARLLPVVEEIARQRAADELEKLAEKLRGLADGPVPAIDSAFDAVVIARADATALRGTR